MATVDLPDFLTENVIKGHDGTTLRTIRVAETGEMYILVSALTGTTLIPLQADALGNLLLNIKAQDLAEVINRPKYGEAEMGLVDRICPAGITTSWLEILGKGIIYAGVVYFDAGISHSDDYLRILIDSYIVTGETFGDCNKFNLGQPNLFISHLLCYDETNYIYAMALQPGITFEESFEFQYHNAAAADITVKCRALYALV